MSGSSLTAHARRRPELNLVPLIDVLVMLIFFSFVTMQFKSATTMNLTLPKIHSAGKNAFKGTVTISIDKDGAIYFNDHKIEDAQLEDLLVQAHNASPDDHILLKADEVSQLKRLTFIEDACSAAGFGSASLQSRK
jgi:biopolymer transport protein ExbD